MIVKKPIVVRRRRRKIAHIESPYPQDAAFLPLALLCCQAGFCPSRKNCF